MAILSHRLVLFVVVSCLVVAAVSEKRKALLTGIDVDAVLENDRLLNKYVECIVADRPMRCPASAIQLRDSIKDSFGDDCSKCSEEEKLKTDKAMKFMIEKKPHLWSKLEAKYKNAIPYKEKLLANENSSTTAKSSGE